MVWTREQMKLPNGQSAVVTDETLFDFLLNEQHENQRGHADLFHRLLGITTANADVLRSALLKAAATMEAETGSTSPCGIKYEIRFEMTGPRCTYMIPSVWIIETGQPNPRLVTGFVE
jgi:hypothetical protein